MSANVLALSQENRRFLSCHGQINCKSFPPSKPRAPGLHGRAYCKQVPRSSNTPSENTANTFINLSSQPHSSPTRPPTRRPRHRSRPNKCIMFKGRRAQSLYCAASRPSPNSRFVGRRPDGTMRFAYCAPRSRIMRHELGDYAWSSE
jgi:hypothetical protein